MQYKTREVREPIARRIQPKPTKPRDFVIPKFIQIVNEESERLMTCIAHWHHEHSEMNISEAPRHKRLAQICRGKLADYHAAGAD